jgi:hypothetical protein
MTTEEAKKYLLDHLDVSPQRVTVAKSYILKQFNKMSLSQAVSSLVEGFLESMEVRKPAQIHLTLDTKTGLSQAVEYFSWQIYAREAIWGLMSEALLVPDSSHMVPADVQIGFTTVIQGSGSSGSIRLDEVSIQLPQNVRMPISALGGKRQLLTDGDLFLHEMNIPSLDEEVEESLREAVKCFRHELFTACLTMLAKASEGAWTKLGLSLLKIMPNQTPKQVDRISKIDKIMTDPFFGVAKRINEVIGLYSQQDLFGTLSEKSGIKLDDLRNSVIWADAVRESRNSVHYGVKPALPNSHEKVAALLIGAVPHIKILYALISACEN